MFMCIIDFIDWSVLFVDGVRLKILPKMASFLVFLMIICHLMISGGIAQSQGNMQRTMTRQYMLRMQGMVNAQKMWLMTQKERLFWMQYQAMMSMKFPLEHLKEENIQNKYQIEEMKKENNELKKELYTMSKEVF